MQLLSDIINDLVDSERNLAYPMLKIKVFASRIKNDNLLKWVNQELDGYDSKDDLPNYRITDARVTMSYSQGHVQVKNAAVPTSGMIEVAKKMLSKAEFRQTVASLTSLATTHDDGILSFQVPAIFEQYVQEHIKRLGNNPYFEVLSISKVVSPNAAVEVLAIIRNRLLDFMLKVEEELGSEVTIESLRSKNQQINNIMYNTITNTGDGNVINTGADAKIDAKISINKGDIDSLKKSLSEIGVNEDDTSTLISIVQDDEVDYANRRFGPKVNHWIAQMMSKALDGTWQIGIGTAGGVLAELLKAYYNI